MLVNPYGSCTVISRCPAEHGFIMLWKHCRSRSEGFCRNHPIRIHTVAKLFKETCLQLEWRRLTCLTVWYKTGIRVVYRNMSSDMKFPIRWHVRPAKAHTSLRIRAVWSEPLLVARIFLWVLRYWLNIIWVSKLERILHRLLRVIPHCWKSHVAAHIQHGEG